MEALRTSVHPPGTTPDAYSDSATLALAAGVSLEYFARKHSLLPFYRTVLREGDAGQRDTYSVETIGYFGTRSWRQSMAIFCPECIKEDEASPRGFAYWRRSHQLPGIPGCVKHGCQLANSPEGTKAFDVMPFPEMDAIFEFSEPEFAEISANPIVQRYASIAIAFLNAEVSTSDIHAQFRIAEQAKKHNLRVCIQGKRATLTDRLLEQVPKYWLRTLYPDIDKHSSTEFFYPIDNVTVGVTAGTSYVLALASLFDSTEEALNYWQGDIEGLPTERKVQRSFGKDYWSSTEMFKLYVEHGGSYKSIGQALAISPSYLRHQLIAAGLPGLGLVNMNTTARAVLDFQAGMSLDAACQSNGASRDEVEKLIRIGISKFSTALNEISQSNPRKESTHQTNDD
ncbi:hypothetical protein GALL_92050 [mine drainage metagenome]|uniref:TniQ domain-containing protein n=1 Tax=mine drainage metagenome TaxID=410659 RepID=A0A1J5T4R1_9ZZZZ